MTVNSDTNKQVYIGDGTTTIFFFNLVADNITWVKTYIGDVLQSDTQVTVFLNSDQDVSAGGQVTFITPPANNAIVSILVETDYLQLQDYEPYSRFPAETIERAFDKITRMAIQLKNTAFNAMTVPIGGFNWDALALRIINLASPVSDNDAANKGYVEQRFSDVVNGNYFFAPLYVGYTTTTGQDYAIPTATATLTQTYIVSLNNRILEPNEYTVNAATDTLSLIVAPTAGWRLWIISFGTAKPTAGSSAGLISYNNAASGLAAANVQSALDEIDADVDTIQANASLYALKAASNTFTQAQNIALAGVTDILNMNTSTGNAACTLASLAGNGYSHIQLLASGTGTAGLIAYTASPLNFRGSITWGNDSAFNLLGASSNSIYTVNAARTAHQFYGGAVDVSYTFSNSGIGGVKIETIQTNTASRITTPQNLMYVEGANSVLSSTTNGGFKVHTTCDYAGNHFADGSGYAGVTDPVIHSRGHFYMSSAAVASASGSSQALGGGVSASFIRTGTGVFDFTISGRSASSGSELFGMACSASTAGEACVSFEKTSRTTFIVRVKTGGGAATNLPFYVEVKW
jgi:hypothetical protein